jgi:S-ribosylhomocysteine lyase
MFSAIKCHTDKVVDLSPMGCQTGFYVSFINHDDYEDVLDIVEKTLHDVLAGTSVAFNTSWRVFSTISNTSS